MFPDIGCPVDPAVGPCILVTTLANDSSPVQMVFQENEQKPKHDHKCGGLVVELEQGIVYCEFIALEPFEKVADNGKSVDDRRSHGG